MTPITWNYTTRESRFVKVENLYIFYHPLNLPRNTYCIGNRPIVHSNGQIYSLDMSLGFFNWIEEWSGRDPETISQEELSLILLKYLG